MEFEQLVKLIDVVSKSALNSFKYEEKGVKLPNTISPDHVKLYAVQADGVRIEMTRK